MKYLLLIAVASAAFFFAGQASAQNAGTVTAHAFALGKGAGHSGYTSLLCGSAQLAVGQSAADPICQTITGDVTISAAGVTSIGATKVTSAMLNSDVFSTAHSWAGQQTFTAPALGTPASGTLTNATGLPVSTGVSGLGTGIATFLATPSSANLRSALTDEVGTGAAYFVGGALGTPASATLTNATGLPVSGLAAQAAYTFVGNNSGSSAVPTAVDISSLTTKASPAAGDYVILSDQAASGAWKKAAVSALASAGSVASLNGQTGAVAAYFPPQGRLTLVTGVPVMVASQASKTTIYYTPYVGNQIPLYDGTNMVPTAFSELSAATTDTTKNPAAIGASKVNDWFVWNDGGTLRLTHGPDWTSDTARSAGTALTMVNGILLNNASITNGPAASRGTYVGTTRSNASSQLDFIPGGSSAGGTVAWIHVWNMYNRRPAQPFVQDSNTSWTYTSATWRSADNSTGNRISFVSGLAEDGVQANYSSMSFSTTASIQTGFSIALDATNAIATGATSFTAFSSGAANQQLGGTASYSGYPGLGVHYLQAIESGGTNGTFIGVNGITSSGLRATILY